MRLNRAAPDASDIEGEGWEIHPMVKHLNFDDPEFVPQDNCYAEAKPANPNAKQTNKEFKDSGTQSFASSNPEFNMLRGGNYYGDMTAAEKRRQKGKLGRGRDIKKQIENKIKEENWYMEQEFDQDENIDLQVIAEAERDSEDDLYKQEAARRKKKAAEEKKIEDESTEFDYAEIQKKILEEDNMMIMEEEKRLEEFKRLEKTRLSNDDSEFRVINDMDT